MAAGACANSGTLKNQAVASKIIVLLRTRMFVITISPALRLSETSGVQLCWRETARVFQTSRESYMYSASLQGRKMDWKYSIGGLATSVSAACEGVLHLSATGAPRLPQHAA